MTFHNREILNIIGMNKTYSKINQHFFEQQVNYSYELYIITCALTCHIIGPLIQMILYVVKVNKASLNLSRRVWYLLTLTYNVSLCDTLPHQL